MSYPDDVYKTPIVHRNPGLWLLRKAIKLSFVVNALIAYKSVPKAFRALKAIRTLLQKFWDQPELNKFVRLGRRFYWSYTGPHWPSKVQQNYLWDELNRLEPFTTKRPGLRVLYYAITSSCPLSCDHCFEWERLNKAPMIGVNAMIRQIKTFQAHGVAQIQLSGGEPLSRFKDLVKIVKNCHNDSDIWVLTSGFGISEAKVKELKASGLRGIAFSLDHHEASKHDAHRGRSGVFEQVIKGTKWAYEADLAICYDLCARREFISKANLLAFAQLAKTNGVSFINLIEPSAVGRYLGQPVNLDHEHQTTLEDFYRLINYDEHYRDYPIIAYPNYQMRKLGCMGGKRILYVDSSGTVNPCPFCHSSKPVEKDQSIEELLENIRTETCEYYEEVAYS